LGKGEIEVGWGKEGGVRKSGEDEGKGGSVHYEPLPYNIWTRNTSESKEKLSKVEPERKCICTIYDF